MGRIKWTFILILGFNSVQAQVNRYMVFFKDKVGTTYNVANPEAFLSTRAIQRRSNQGISVSEQDIPVVEAYVTGVKNASGTVKVLYRTKWMNGVLVECMPSDVATLTALTFVNAVEYVAPGARPAGRMRSSSEKFKDVSGVATPTDTQLNMIALDDMHADGYHGEGMLIGILDAGFPGADTISFFKHIFNESRFDATTSYDFVTGSSNVFAQNSHGTHVWSIMGGYKPGLFVGGAYKASFVLFITEHAPTEYRVEEYNWLFAIERADSVGVDVVNTSLGYNTFDDASMNYSKLQMDGATAVITRAANIAASKGIAVVVSAGNEGNDPSWGIITSPADSEDVFTIGSVNTGGTRVSTSSTGPTSDGRIKPDVAALGSPVSLIAPNGSVSSGSGTSYASPLAASLVAGAWQKLPELTAQQLLARIRESSSQAGSPDNFLGYGIPNFIDVVLDAGSEIESGSMNVFPNPAYDEVRIEFVNNASPNPITFNVVDAKGIKTHAMIRKVSDSEFILDASSLKSGLYLIRCQQGRSVVTRKIVKSN